MGFEQPGCAELKKEMDNFFISTGADRRNIYKKCLKQNTGDYPNIPCLDQIGAYQWFNDPQFRKGIHVNISESKKWTICNDDIQKIYFKDPRGSYFLYPSLIEARLRIVNTFINKVGLFGSTRRQQPSHWNYEVDRRT